MTAAGARIGAQATDYVVGAQDALVITVFNEPELSGKFTVEADGTFTFPLVGRITAGGLTLRALESELRKRLLDGYLKKPQVSVAVDAYRSQRVFVVGEVRQPGTYPLTGDMRLIEVIARAGSTTPSAAAETLIVRPPSGKPVTGPHFPTGAEQVSSVLHVNLRALQSGASEDNPALQDGDTVFVPPAESFYVFGEVRAPGAFVLRGETTVLQALSLAGGLNDRGASSRIKIVRIVNGNKVELKVKLSDRVRAGDTVIVPERYF